MQIELKRLQREVGITFVFVTHDQEEALTMSDRIAVMSHGEALQIGDANEIYEQPNCRFVADFIGDTNFLDGRVVAQNGRSASIVLPGGQTVYAEIAQPLNSGAQVHVAVRPEKMHLHPGAPSESGAANQLRGRVANVIYIGTDTHYEVRLPGDEHIRVREQNDQPGSRPLAHEGDEVTVSFSAEAARVLME
jgi:spermidine/putrescine transport system ATP-binding protein